MSDQGDDGDGDGERELRAGTAAPGDEDIESIGELSTTITADTSEFEESIDRSIERVQDLNAELEHTLDLLDELEERDTDPDTVRPERASRR